MPKQNLKIFAKKLDSTEVVSQLIELIFRLIYRYYLIDDVFEGGLEEGDEISILPEINDLGNLILYYSGVNYDGINEVLKNRLTNEVYWPAIFEYNQELHQLIAKDELEFDEASKMFESRVLSLLYNKLPTIINNANS